MSIPESRYLIPDGVLLDITTRCPHKCAYCYHQKKSLLKPADMSIETFDSIIPILKKEKFHRILLFMSGEPILHPSFYYFLKRCGEGGFETTVATKAGLSIDWNKIKAAQKAFQKGRAVLKWLIECPAVKQETADHICNIDLEKQKENLHVFGKMEKSRAYKNITWKVRTIVTKWNENELAKIGKEMKKMGFSNWKPKTPGYFIAKLEDDNDWMPSNRYNRRLKVGPKRCPFPRNAAISTGGNVSICCHDMLFKYNLGNMVERGTLKNILLENKDLMRRRLSKKIDICKFCN